MHGSTVSKYLSGLHLDKCGRNVGHSFVKSMLAKPEDPLAPYYMTNGCRVYNDAFMEAPVP